MKQLLPLSAALSLCHRAGHDRTESTCLPHGPAGCIMLFPRSATSGFCVYNDAAIAITRLRQQFDAEIPPSIQMCCIMGTVCSGLSMTIRASAPTPFTRQANSCFPGTGFVHGRGTDRLRHRYPVMPVRPLRKTEWSLARGSQLLHREVAVL